MLQVPQKKLEKKLFNQNLFNSKENFSIKQNRDYSFILNYFGPISETQNIPIEKFFMFRNCTHRFDKNIPTTITWSCVQLWKKSPQFIGEVRNYLDSKFLSEVKDINLVKIDRLIKKWTRFAIQKGLSNCVDYICSSVQLKGTKLPWTIVEAQRALSHAVEILK